MSGQNFTATITVDKSPEEAFAAINDVRGWWSETVEGGTEKLGDEFTFDIPGVHYSRIRLIDVVPGRRVVWRVVDAAIQFVEDKTEWTGTEIVFEISEKDGQTEVHFTHVGLVPAYECFDLCSNAWSTYVTGSLRSLITTGKGAPIGKADS